MITGVSLAVVTGGGHGIGRALCQRLAKDDVRVVVADIDGTAAAKVAAEVTGDAFELDVGVEDEIEAMVQSIESDSGPIDMFVSNAGVAFGDADGSAASAKGGMRQETDRWETCWRVNVMAHVYAARAMIPRMRGRGGYLVNVASAAGLLAQIGDAAYTATKHAAVGFAESLAITHGDDGIRVCMVCPQAVATRMIGADGDDPAASRGFGGNAIDGILSPAEAAERIVAGIAEGRFLILPHAEVKTYAQRRAADHDRWIRGMQRFRRELGGDDR